MISREQCTDRDQMLFHFKIFNSGRYVLCHSSQFLGLCSTKSSREMLQNLPYFWNMKNPKSFFVLHFKLDIDQSWTRAYCNKSKVAWNVKQKTSIWVFLFQKYGKFWGVSFGAFHQAQTLKLLGVEYWMWILNDDTILGTFHILCKHIVQVFGPCPPLFFCMTFHTNLYFSVFKNYLSIFYRYKICVQI